MHNLFSGDNFGGYGFIAIMVEYVKINLESYN